VKYNPENCQEHLLEGIECAIESIGAGVRKVNVETQEGDVTAYRVGSILRIDLKNVDEEAIKP
jgi:hypothetical protein